MQLIRSFYCTLHALGTANARNCPIGQLTKVPTILETKMNSTLVESSLKLPPRFSRNLVSVRIWRVFLLVSSRGNLLGKWILRSYNVPYAHTHNTHVLAAESIHDDGNFFCLLSFLICHQTTTQLLQLRVLTILISKLTNRQTNISEPCTTKRIGFFQHSQDMQKGHLQSEKNN